MVSIPTVSAKGTKIGVTAAIVASSSINIPRIIKNPTIINKIIFGSLLTETLHSASLWGTCCIINTLANNCVTATTIKTIPDVSTENTKDSHNTLMFLSFLVTNKPTNKAYRTATTEASTGVNIPPYIPPIITTGANNDHLFFHKAFINTINLNGSPVPLYPLFFAITYAVIISITPRKIPGSI